VKDAEQAIDTLKRSWRPVEFEVGSVCLLSRKSFDDPFQLRWEVPLGRDRRQQLATSKLRNLKYAAAPPQRADAELANLGCSSCYFYFIADVFAIICCCLVYSIFILSPKCNQGRSQRSVEALAGSKACFSSIQVFSDERSILGIIWAVRTGCM
ncbi:unnamed protein product, partial [Polarella glacialis]